MTGMFMLDDGIEGWLREYPAREVGDGHPSRLQISGVFGLT